MTLKEAVSNLPLDRNMVLSSGRLWTHASVIAPHAKIDSLKGIKIAFCVSDVGLALQFLVALDGVAAQILLLSPASSPEENQALALRASCDALMTDVPELAIQDANLPAFKTLEALVASFKTFESLTISETRWIMSTSGTSGPPKLVSHSLASLSKSSKINFDLGLAQKWGMVYDYTRFAGMQVLLQSVLSGALLIAPSYDVVLDDKLRILAANGCTHLSATPTFWRKIIMTPTSRQLELKQVTMGGEIADDRILSSVQLKYPAARVVHIFASTEAGVGFSVSDGKAGFPTSFLTAPPANIEVQIMAGTLHVRNPLVKRTYVGAQTELSKANGWVDTGDAVQKRGDRVFFLGRVSGVINVGGDKVHPEEVEQVLLSHPYVVATRVYAKDNPITGAVVAADIVLTTDASADAKCIKNIIKNHASAFLKRHQVPAFVKIVTEFDLNAAGKLQRG